ncbi:MAG: T9SS type A sorting domain-containing protein [Syntrophothermus sp.]
MKKLLMFLLLLELTVPSFAVNTPSNFNAIGCNGYVKLTWTNPIGNYSGVAIFKNGVEVGSVIAGNTAYQVTVTPHQSNSFYLKAFVDGADGIKNKLLKVYSSPTNSLIEYAVKCYYLGPPTAPTTNTGTSWDDIMPYTSFNYNVSNYKGGDTIYFAYFISQPIQYYSLGSGISITGSQPGQVNINSPRRLVFASGHLEKTRSSNRAIMKSSTNGDDCISTDGIDWLTIVGFNVIPENQDVDGINFSYSSNCLITDNIFSFNKGNACIKGKSGSTSNNCDNNIISHNIVNGSTDGGDSFKDGDFVVLARTSETTTATLTGNIIEYNTVLLQNSEQGNDTDHHSDMVQIYNLRIGDEIIIRNNYFTWAGTRTDGNTGGIYATSKAATNPGGLIKIYNNIFIYNSAGKAAVHIDNVTKATGQTPDMVVKVWNNTFYVSSAWQVQKNSFLIQLTGAPDITVTGQPSEFKNNVIYDAADIVVYQLPDPPYTTFNYKMTPLVLDGTPTWSSILNSENILINYNLYYTPNKATGDARFVWNTTSCSTLTAFRTASAQEGNSSMTDPLFYDSTPETADDLRARDWCSPMVNTGVDLSAKFTGDYCYPTHDRGTTWYRGAYEDLVDNDLCKANDETKFDNYSLEQNYPNPFNPVTHIKYSIPNDGNVSLIIYDALGREVKKLLEGEKSKGEYSVDFDASNLGSGVYFYRLVAKDFVQAKKMILLK